MTTRQDIISLARQARECASLFVKDIGNGLLVVSHNTLALVGLAVVSVLLVFSSQAGLRAKVDDRQEKVNYKIREAQLQKIPYMLVVGDREAAENTVAVRSRAKGDLGARAVGQFVTDALAEVQAKALS